MKEKKMIKCVYIYRENIDESLYIKKNLMRY